MNILRNLVQMTCQRDHLRLEFSVLSTLLQLPGVTGVRALELHQVHDSLWVRARTWHENDTLVSTDYDFLRDPQRHPLSDLPALAHCIATQDARAEHCPDGHTHILWLPVWMQDRVHVCIEVTQAGPYGPHELDVLLAIFQVYQNYQSLLDYSERDALTGLLNRKTFDDHLLRFSATAAEQTHDSEPPWIAVLDIDHFKHVNDQYGHLFGDEVLILMANLLRASFGMMARIFRFGGEEFVVLLHPMTPEQAYETLEHFRATVAGYDFPQVGRVTVSIGFAGARLLPAVELLGQADQALYYAKGNGRNQVCQYEQLHTDGLLDRPSINHEDVELF